MNKNKIVSTTTIRRGGLKCVLTATKEAITSGQLEKSLREIINTLGNKLESFEEEDEKNCKCTCCCKK